DRHGADAVTRILHAVKRQLRAGERGGHVVGRTSRFYAARPVVGLHVELGCRGGGARDFGTHLPAAADVVELTGTIAHDGVVDGRRGAGVAHAAASSFAAAAAAPHVTTGARSAAPSAGSISTGARRAAGSTLARRSARRGRVTAAASRSGRD